MEIVQNRVMQSIVGKALGNCEWSSKKNIKGQGWTQTIHPSRYLSYLEFMMGLDEASVLTWHLKALIDDAMKGMPRTQDRIVRLGWSLMADGMMIRWMIMDQSFLLKPALLEQLMNGLAILLRLVGWLVSWLQNHLISNVGYHRICVCNCFMFVY